MSSTAAGWLQFALLVVALAACYVPLGNYIARIFTAKDHWRVERGIYKLMRDRPGSGHAVERLRRAPCSRSRWSACCSCT